MRAAEIHSCGARGCHSELYEDFLRVATPEQLERFEHWKRSKFPRTAMRKLMGDILGSSTERGTIVLVRCGRPTSRPMH